ncbi:LacI family DNA-binding transcriptional regulator [Streptomyces sp. NPDC101213]|uniref:LacI family DNA-binding transcriptional regulator n=1 Tax=Streptomyces sp. NPDC101213 TaxID=3366130 RepID=UPI003810EE57
MKGPETPRAVTATDVARMAQVSQSTVSLVLNGKWKGRIREETALRVMTMASDLGYQVNLAARSLRLGSTGTVLLVVPTLENPAFSAVHAGAARAGATNGIGVVVFPLTAEDGCGPFPAPKQAIDGVLACSMSADDVADLRIGLPLVILDETPTRHTPTVSMDLGGGMAHILAHLVSLGHRRIMHVRADRPTSTFAERAHVFDQCVLSHPDITASHVSCPLDPRNVRDRLVAVLASPARPTAFVCDDDNIAMGVYYAASTLDLTVGEALSVVGFNDLPIASLVIPSLTTVRLPLNDLGFHGMQMFMDIRIGEAVEDVVLGTELVIRQSTGPAPLSTGVG